MHDFFWIGFVFCWLIEILIDFQFMILSFSWFTKFDCTIIVQFNIFYFVIHWICFSWLFINHLIWFDLSHTPTWHQSEVSPCGRTIETIKKLNEKKILKSNPEMKNFFNRQKQRDVMTSFCYFSINESYNPCSHKKQLKQNQKNKIKFINVEFSFVNVSFLWSNFEQILNKFVYYVINVVFLIILSCFGNYHKIEKTIVNWRTIMNV